MIRRLFTTSLRGLFCSALFLVSSPFLQAQGVSIVTPVDGAELVNTSAFFDPAAEEVLVTISFFVPAGTQANYELIVQGERYPIPAGILTIKRIHVGPNPPPGGWPARYPYLINFIDPNRLHLPLLVELFDITTQSVVGRDRVVLFDKRQDDDMIQKASGQAPNTLAFQITPEGMPKFGPTHTSTLPQPDLAQFNQALTANIAGATSSGAAPSEVCTPLNDLPAEFKSTNAYDAVRANAWAQYALYQAAKKVVDSGAPVFLGPFGWLGTAAAQAIVSTSCVQQAPFPRDFEVCVDRVDAEMKSLELAQVISADLELGPDEASILSDPIQLGHLDGLADGYVRGATYRWTAGSSTCIGAPTQAMDDAEFLLFPALDDWSLCPDLQVDAVSATSGAPVSFVQEPDGFFFEEQNVRRTQSTDFFVNPNLQTSTAKGACADFDLAAAAEAAVLGFAQSFNDAISETWDAGSPMQQAEALDKLLSRLEVGTFEPTNHTTNALIDGISSFTDLDGDNISDIDGLYGVYVTDSKPTLGSYGIPPTFVYSPPGPRPWSTNSRDFYGNPTDVIFGTTTGALNQVLGALAVTDRVIFEFEPTWAEIGLDPADYGLTESDPVPLTGDVLSDFNPTLAAIGSSTIDIYVIPTKNPFTWINPDPPPLLSGQPVDQGRASLTYQMADWLILFVEPIPGQDPKIWLTIAADFFDPDFKLLLNPQEGSEVLTAGLSNRAALSLTLLQGAFPGCQLVPAGTPGVAFTCAGQLQKSVGDMMGPRLKETLRGLLSEIPAPMWFDAKGEATLPKHLRATDRYLWEQHILFYAEIP